MDSVLLVFLSRTLIGIVKKYALPPCLKSAGISFDDEESQRNGITLLCRYEIESLAGKDMKKEWVIDPSWLVEWTSVRRGAERMLSDDSPLRYTIGMDPFFKTDNGEIVMLCRIDDPMIATLRPTSGGQYVSYVSCGMCDHDPYDFGSLGHSLGRSHDRDYCLTRRKRASRRNVEVRQLDLTVRGRQLKNLFSQCRFTFKLVDYKFSNKEGEIERMKKEYENFPSQGQSSTIQGDIDRYAVFS